MIEKLDILFEFLQNSEPKEQNKSDTLKKVQSAKIINRQVIEPSFSGIDHEHTIKIKEYKGVF